ncbi:MAG: Hsp20/alpha crystallin family protein [Acidimicrobiales bacterium]
MLMRFDPFRDFDRLAQSLWNGGSARPPAGVPIDAHRVGEELRIDLDLPGVDPASVDLTVEKNVLTVSVERPRDIPEGAEVLVSERPHGAFTRQLFLGDNLDTDRIAARSSNGVLSITIPVAERAKARRVSIEAQEAIEEVAAVGTGA